MISKFLLGASSFFLLLGPSLTKAQGERVFVDDRGTRHVFTGQPSIAAEASKGALALHSFGVGDDQLLAVRGLWKVRGSNQGATTADAQDVHAPVDPTQEELNWLNTRVNLSPMCHNDPIGCWETPEHIDFDLLAQVNPDYYVFVNGGFEQTLTAIHAYEDAGVPVIFIDTWFENHPDCPVNKTGTYDNCSFRSMLGITKRLEELALALTGESEIPMQAQVERTNACAAAEGFQTTMKEAHDKGIRVGVAVMRMFDGEIVWNLNEPIAHWPTRTYEELGMPLVHTREVGWSYDGYTADEWFVNCPQEEIATTCNDQVAIPIDFYLIDSQTYLDATGADFLALFPDRALLAGQHWMFARNDGKLTYAAIATILNEAATRIKNAERLYPKTPCTTVDVTSLQHNDLDDGGLDQGEYACYNSEVFPEDYTSCPNLESDGSGASTSGVAPTGRLVLAMSIPLVSIGMLIFIS